MEDAREITGNYFIGLCCCKSFLSPRVRTPFLSHARCHFLRLYFSRDPFSWRESFSHGIAREGAKASFLHPSIVSTVNYPREKRVLLSFLLLLRKEHNPLRGGGGVKKKVLKVLACPIHLPKDVRHNWTKMRGCSTSILVPCGERNPLLNPPYMPQVCNVWMGRRAHI